MHIIFCCALIIPNYHLIFKRNSVYCIHMRKIQKQIVSKLQNNITRQIDISKCAMKLVVAEASLK